MLLCHNVSASVRVGVGRSRPGVFHGTHNIGGLDQTLMEKIGGSYPGKRLYTLNYPGLKKKHFGQKPRMSRPSDASKVG